MAPPARPLELPPLALYVHIPWCEKKCPYCDFNSHASAGPLPEKNYVNALIADIKNDLGWVQERKISSIFFGGGTPSLFSGHSINAVLLAAEELIGFEDGIEITLEANPGSADQIRFQSYREAGVNRLSIGIQSFNSDHLARLGRVHNSRQAHDAINAARAANFGHINIDLMHGLPQQTTEESSYDLQCAMAADVEHISWYQLTIEANTAFHSHPPELPAEDRLATINLTGMDELESGGYRQYEVSAFAKNNCESKHNRNYWEFGDYLGIGAGAHGKITLMDRQTIVRSQRTRQPGDYLSQHALGAARSKEIPFGERPMEFMMNALRLKEGFPATSFSPRTGIHNDRFLQSIHDLEAKGLLSMQSGQVRATPLGYRFLDSVLERFARRDWIDASEA